MTPTATREPPRRSGRVPLDGGRAPPLCGRRLMRIVDSDQHLYESRTLWREHIEPTLRDEALRI